MIQVDHEIIFRRLFEIRPQTYSKPKEFTFYKLFLPLQSY